MYDFSRCKLCSGTRAVPVYFLRDTRIYVCPECGFHYAGHLDDLPGPEAGTGGGLTEKGRSYIESRLHENLGQNLRRLNLMKRYAALKGAHGLDVGAGVGVFLDLLAREGVIGRGIEPSGPRREFATLTYGIPLREETVESSFWQEGFRDSFDLVTLWDVIEHVNFPRETLAGVFRLLRPGGVLFLDTPSREAWDYRLGEFSCRVSGGRSPLFLETIYARVPFGHKQIFTPTQMVVLLQGLGFEVLCSRRDHEPGASSLTSRLFSLVTRIFPGKGIVVVARKPLEKAGLVPTPPP